MDIVPNRQPRRENKRGREVPLAKPEYVGMCRGFENRKSSLLVNLCSLYSNQKSTDCTAESAVFFLIFGWKEPPIIHRGERVGEKAVSGGSGARSRQPGDLLFSFSISTLCRSVRPSFVPLHAAREGGQGCIKFEVMSRLYGGFR